MGKASVCGESRQTQNDKRKIIISHFHDCPHCGEEYQCDLGEEGWPQEYCPELDDDTRLCVECENDPDWFKEGAYKP